MKYTLSLLTIILLFACSCTQHGSAPIKGKWELVAIDPAAPGAAKNAEDSMGIGLATVAIAMAMGDSNVMEFTGDSCRMGGKTTGSYTTHADMLITTNTSNKDSFTYKITNDTLTMTSSDKLFALKLKRKK